MRYFCENCGTEVNTSVEGIEDEDAILDCGICGDGRLRRLPNYETVAEWEKHKGRPYPDTAPVYAYSNANNQWYCASFRQVGEISSGIGAAMMRIPRTQLVVATEAGAPL